MLVRAVDRYHHFDPEPRVTLRLRSRKADSVSRFWQASEEQTKVMEEMFANKS